MKHPMSPKEATFHSLINLARIFLLIVGIISLILVLLLLYLRFENEYRISIDNSETYVIDFSSIFGVNWRATSIMKDYEDISGWTPSLAGRSQIWIYNISDPLSFIKHYVMAYMDDNAATTRYSRQKATLVHELNDPSSISHYEEIDLSNDITFRADKYYTACEEVVSVETKCVGLFLYNRYVVFVNIFLVRNGVRYLSHDDLKIIFTNIDNKMSVSEAPQ